MPESIEKVMTEWPEGNVRWMAERLNCWLFFDPEWT